MEKLVYIIILTWNNSKDTIECIDSYLNTVYKNKRILIVDNASSDGSIEIIQEKFSKQVEFLFSDKNNGIAYGYNLGIEYALKNSPGYIIVSNNDVIVEESFINEMVIESEKLSDAGILFPKIFHYPDDRTKIWTTGAKWRKFPPTVKMLGLGKEDGETFSEVKAIEFAPSCCLLLNPIAIKKAGLFDTSYFFYNDDWDYCLRVRNAGYKIYFIPTAKIWHKISLSTQNSDKPAYWWFQYGKSTRLFYNNHFNKLYLTIFSLWFLIRELIKLKPKRIIPFIKGVLNLNY